MTVTVYSSDGCMQCKFTKELLDREGVVFIEKNISDSETHKKEVIDMGFQGVPVTSIKDSSGDLVLAIFGFDPEALQALNGLEAKLD